MSSILVVGSGVVGQATGKGFIRKGHDVSFVDINHDRIRELKAQGLRAMTIEDVEWDDVDIVMLTVSTPTINRKIVLDHVKAAARDVGYGIASTDRHICVVMRSTLPPTTTEKQILPLLEATSRKKVGEDFSLAMNPEFLRQKSSERDFDSPWITVLGAYDEKAGEILRKLYAPFGGLLITCKPTEAEMIKYVNNVYNAVKISYFNEVHAVCEQLGVDSNLIGAVVARSAESMWNPLYGTRGGVPYGGACLPKDTLAFMEFCNEHGFEHLVLEATIQANEHLERHIPAVVAPDEIDAALRQAKTRPEAVAERMGFQPKISRNGHD